MIRVVGAAIVHEGKVLVARRAPDAARGGLWELPGGKVESGETDRAALEREIREELAMEIEAGLCLGEVEHDYGDVSICLVGYAARWVRDGPVAREHDALAWADAADLDELRWAPADIPLLPALRRLLS